MADKISKVIAVEEHFMSEKVNEVYKEVFLKSAVSSVQLEKASFIDAFVGKGYITEVGEKRLSMMDESGIDVQMISYGNNSPMYLDAKYAVPLCRQANDDLAMYCRLAPERFYGFAVLPAADINASVAELERCVKELNFKGVIFNGNFKGQFFDTEKYFPIFEKAAELKIPVQFHPGEVADSVSAHYYRGSWPLSVTNVFSGHGIGWHYDSGIQYIRMILSGIFERLPELTLICGHWGEMIPYYFNRLDATLTPEVTGLQHNISYYFKNNMYITPSGMFYEDDFRFCLDKMGAERILWATDYPYCGCGNSKDYLNDFDAPIEEKKKIAYKNAEKLFGI